MCHRVAENTVDLFHRYLHLAKFKRKKAKSLSKVCKSTY